MFHPIALLGFGILFSTAQGCYFRLVAVGLPGGPKIVQTASHVGAIMVDAHETGFIFLDDATFNLSDDGKLTNRDLTCPMDYDGGLQCTSGAEFGIKFGLTSDGTFLHDGREGWLACPTNWSFGGYHVNSDLRADKTGCLSIILKMDWQLCDTAKKGRAIAAAPSPSPPESCQNVAAEEPATATCPTDISPGPFEFPHLIVPTSPVAPSQSLGNSSLATISTTNTTLFNFDIPSSYTGSCSLLFLFPYMSEMSPSAGAYKYSGQEQVVYQNGGLNFALLDGIANAETTFTSTPPVKADYGKVAILPGNRYTVATFPCQSGTPITIQVRSVNNTSLRYSQNSARSPIGLYVVPCA
ncbi:hypothetical protein LZ554_008747 [Drepanopeziza brunnea f. sp. 'monogermtubi']|nr:hypothetical protein LZ554_008747 [Drepanopeziza brunnea f. sp. 'monogermtubi']